MYDIFKTTLLLSLFGFGATSLLLLLKPLTTRKLPAKWQYCVWIIVLISMVLPTYKMVPANREVQSLLIVPTNPILQTEIQPQEDQHPDTMITYHLPPEYREIHLSPKIQIRLSDLLVVIWILGIFLFLFIVLTNYFCFLRCKRKKSMKIYDNRIFSELKNELGIKRAVRLKAVSDTGSPMLVGILFPIVYLPCRDIPDDSMRMILLHELTHYKRKDLLVKWFAVLVNAIHWFNPLCYLACANLSEACEVACDMSVTKNMSEEERKLYMQTILKLVEERNERNA